MFLFNITSFKCLIRQTSGNVECTITVQGLGEEVKTGNVYLSVSKCRKHLKSKMGGREIKMSEGWTLS